MKQSCLGDKGRNGGLSLVKFNANLIEYIETESIEWCNTMKKEGMMVRLPNKGKPTKKTYDQLQGLRSTRVRTSRNSWVDRQREIMPDSIGICNMLQIIHLLIWMRSYGMCWLIYWMHGAKL